MKLSNSTRCEFYRQLAAEEGPNHTSAGDILAKPAESALSRRQGDRPGHDSLVRAPVAVSA
jgi:hypothetical protein